MPTSIIGRLGCCCFRHWAWVLLAWLPAVGAGVFSVGPLFDRLADSRPPREVESVAAADAISQGNAPPAP